MKGAIANTYAPIFNTPKSPFASATIPLDSQGRIFSMETIAFPGTEATILEELPNNIWKIATPDHPVETDLFTDSRFWKRKSTPPLCRIQPTLTEKGIVQALLSTLGTRYFWGGVCPLGVPEIIQIYPHHKPSNLNASCVGLDCSGLLRFATQGQTPHSTRLLCSYGKQIPDIKRPLDLVVWPGHVVIALNSTEAIESILNQGVVLAHLQKRIEEIRRQNKPLQYRRWFTPAEQPDPEF